jgi:hypothetical protein
MSPDLPPRALKALEEAQESFSGKPLKVALVYKLDAMHVRRALAHARREAAEDQVPAVVYSPKAAEPLVIVEAEELASLLKSGIPRTGASE